MVHFIIHMQWIHILPICAKYIEAFDFYIVTKFQVIDINGCVNNIMWNEFILNSYSSIFWQTFFISKQPKASITHAYLLDKSRFSFKDKSAMAREVFLI